MTWEPGQSGNPLGRAVEKPWRDAIRMEMALAEQGIPTPARKGTVRYAARKLLDRASESLPDAQEMGNRLDGKPVTIVEGGDNPLTLTFQAIERVIVDPRPAQLTAKPLELQANHSPNQRDTMADSVTVNTPLTPEQGEELPRPVEEPVLSGSREP